MGGVKRTKKTNRTNNNGIYERTKKKKNRHKKKPYKNDTHSTGGSTYAYDRPGSEYYYSMDYPVERTLARTRGCTYKYYNDIIFYCSTNVVADEYDSGILHASARKREKEKRPPVFFFFLTNARFLKKILLPSRRTSLLYY